MQASTRILMDVHASEQISRLVFVLFPSYFIIPIQKWRGGLLLPHISQDLQ